MVSGAAGDINSVVPSVRVQTDATVVRPGAQYGALVSPTVFRFRTTRVAAEIDTYWQWQQHVGMFVSGDEHTHTEHDSIHVSAHTSWVTEHACGYSDEFKTRILWATR